MHQEYVQKLSYDDLEDLVLAANLELQRRDHEALIEDLKKSETIKKYSYILFEDEFEDGVFHIGFSSEKPGYIDDHVDEKDRDEYHDMLDVLHLSDEIGRCTYAFNQEKKQQLVDLLNQLGLRAQEPAW
jgi:hypothetical protein